MHVTLLGGGFGRKSKPDYVVEAALLSKKTGRPVKVTWTREDEIHHSYYHSVSAQQLEAGLDAAGRPVAWLHRTAFPPIRSTFEPNADLLPTRGARLGFTECPSTCRTCGSRTPPSQAYVRIGWLRSVANIYHAFAISRSRTSWPTPRAPTPATTCCR